MYQKWNWSRNIEPMAVKLAPAVHLVIHKNTSYAFKHVYTLEIESRTRKGANAFRSGVFHVAIQKTRPMRRLVMNWLLHVL